MNSRLHLSALLLSFFAAVPAGAQMLTVHDLAQGSPARFEYDGGTPGGFAFLVLGFGGLGPDLCFELDACWNLLPPTALVGTVAIDGSGQAVFPLPLGSSVPAVPISSQVLEVVVVGSTLDYKTSNPLASTIASIASLGDDFETGGLGAGWTVLHPELGTAEVAGGQLVLTPNAGGLPNMWYHDGEGLGVVRSVVGDFELTCEVQVHAPGAPNLPPPTGYRLAGLLIRDPGAAAPGAHEWCHVATGSGGAGQTTGVEWKHTHDSFSLWAVTPSASTHRELRLLREGPVITAWHRDLGATPWTLLQTYAFPDLPGIVEVGAMAYSNDPTPELVARYEWIALAAP